MKIVSRELRIRGKPQQIRELADIAAIRSDAPVKTGGLKELAPEDAISQFSRFESAGWRFISREAVKGKSEKVYLKQNGRLAIGTDRLTVQLKPDLTHEEATAWLEAQQFGIVDQLRFGTNLFVVSTVRQDTTVVAQELAANDQVKFAEPEFIEALPGR